MKFRIRLCKSLLFFLVTLFSEYGSAQRTTKPVRIADELACSRCELSFQAKATLVVPRDTGDVFPSAIRVDAQRRYWVFRDEAVPVLFDAEGKFLRTLGRLGRGPGEFQMAYDLLLVGNDSLVVMDAVTRRATVLTKSLVPVRYVSLPLYMMTPIVISWPKAIVSGGTLPTPDGIGRELHRTSLAGTEGAVLKSFGPGDGEVTGSDASYLLYQNLAQPRNGMFWTSAQRTYDLFQWRADGSLVRAMQRRPTWFAKPSPMNYNWKVEPPPPHIAAIEEDREGLLWIFLKVAATTWREAWPVVPEAVREAPGRLIQTDKLFATTIEVIDPRTKRVVARRTFQRFLIGSLSDRRAVFYDVDPSGEARIVVGTLSLSNR